MTFEELRDTFELLGDWEERYKFLIDLGRQLPPLPDAARCEANQVRGCLSQVWLLAESRDGVLHFAGDSDALLVKGLVALLLGLVNRQSPQQVLALDLAGIFRQLGLEAHITANRRNGFYSMVERIRQVAAAA